jgi:glutamate N-acetyltransferase/amino-acid N-acetyltransferase
VELTVDLAGHEATILGLAKGAGMIHPSLDLAPQATMLVFLLTDAAASPQALREAVHDALPRSFHAITVDGDTSTNDSLLCLANGRAGNPLIENYSSPGGGAFYAALGRACRSLAEQIVADAEGVTKVVTIQVKGAGSDMEADMAAIAIALSPLCKTAFFGADPNWGRVICAVGYSGARVEPDKVDISFGGAMVCQGGVPTPAENLDLAQAAMKGQAFTVVVDLHLGEASKEFLTTDLSYDYVRINAEYTT